MTAFFLSAFVRFRTHPRARASADREPAAGVPCGRRLRGLELCTPSLRLRCSLRLLRCQSLRVLLLLRLQQLRLQLRLQLLLLLTLPFLLFL